MLFEGLILLIGRRRVTADLIVALATAGLIGYSIAAVTGVPVVGRPWWPIQFHVAVVVLALWTGLQWARLARRQTDSTNQENL
jgi:hypothetical protein